MATNTKIKLVTHSGSFHADDIFAAATIALVLEGEGKEFEIIRTRDEKIIESGDYVFDVGGVYDEEKNRFDHHQPGGADRRQNGIEYASVGLVWKKFGEILCGGAVIAAMVDNKLIAPIDAGDNGIDLVSSAHETKPYFIQHALKSFRPIWREATEEKYLEKFLECVKFAKEILINEIVHAQAVFKAKEKINEIYRNTADKRIIVLDERYPWEDEMVNYPEPIFVIFPRPGGLYGVEGVMKEKFSFEKRKKFPAAWAGLRDKELQKASGVIDALFCHRGLFMAVAKSKEGAIKLAELALLEPSP